MSKIILYDFDGTLTTKKVPVYPIMKKAISQMSFLNMLRMIENDNIKKEPYLWYYKTFKNNGIIRNGV